MPDLECMCSTHPGQKCLLQLWCAILRYSSDEKALNLSGLGLIFWISQLIQELGAKSMRCLNEGKNADVCESVKSVEIAFPSLIIDHPLAMFSGWENFSEKLYCLIWTKVIL